MWQLLLWQLLQRSSCQILSVQFKNLWFSQVGILSWGKLRTPNSYIDFSVPRNCCEGEAKSVCYGRVLMASDAFCQKGWNNLNCCVGNGSKCWPNRFLRLTQTDVAFSQEITVGIQIFNGFKWWWKENVSGGSKSIFGCSSGRTMHYIQMGVSRPVIDLHLAKRNAIMYKK